MQNVTINDPWEAAEKAELQTSTGEFYGLAYVDVSFVKLVKGTGKIPFDPQTDNIADRRTNIDIQIEPIQPATFLPRRQLLDNSNAWVKITWQSLKDLGMLSLRELNNKYVKYANVGTGRKYADKNGEQKEETTFKFLAVYNTKAECEAAKNGGAPAQAQPQAAQPAQPDERKIALTFVGALAKQTGNDKAKLAAAIAGNPLTSKFFTIDSPEVTGILAAMG